MEGMNLLQDNLALVIGIGAGLLGVLLLIYRIEGFAKLLWKAIGIVLQQLCSLVIEAVCLIFKIINSLEIYIVLLIDALTGKVSSNGKIASLAIGVLSIASFYTTYTGMLSLIEPESIAFLITLGIQAILLSTSLSINEILKLNERGKNIFFNKDLAIGAVIACVGSCIGAYVLGVIDLSYSVKKVVNYILYMVIIVAVIIVVFLLILQLIKTGIPNLNQGIFLFIIYFAVLSVSSFFSYNAFVEKLYPESVRDIDVFQTYKVDVIALIEYVDETIDNEYYEAVKMELESNLQELEKWSTELNFEEILNPSEYEIYINQTEYEKYIRNTEELTQIKQDRENENARWLKEEKDLFDSSGGIGPNTRNIWEAKKQAHEERMSALNQKIETLSNEINKVSSNIVLHVDDYKKIEIKLQNYDCFEEVDNVRVLLEKNEWTEDDKTKLEEAISVIEETRLNTAKGDILTNNFRDMVEVYHSYTNYKKQSSDKLNNILKCSGVKDKYEEAYGQIQSELYGLLKELPEVQYTFESSNGEKIQTKNLPKSDYYSSAESLRRKTSNELSSIEKNVRTFLDNKLIGIICILMAVIIDMMILFVGIILPPNICFKYDSKGKYSEQDIRRILSNLFNKPIRR